MEENNLLRGSEWHRWDLHLHTASSYDYKYKGTDADELLVKTLKENKVFAVCITDHFLIDQNRIKRLRSLAPELKFFPGVELRTDKGDTNIHVILIFDIVSNLNELCEDFNAFKRIDAKCSDDDEKIYWDFQDIIKFAHTHQALISIHAGRKSNGVDRQITNALEHNQAVKEEYAKNVDIFEMGQLRDLDDYRNNVFPSIGKKPMVICSDNHDPRNYNPSQLLWIKSDLTFEGLKQILYEPEDRVRLQNDNPIFDIEKSPFTQINIPHQIKLFVEDDDIQFAPMTLPLNSNLVSIIGGRGTGKSQLINYIAAAFNDKIQYGKYNFNTDITINYTASLSEEDKPFKVSEKPNVPFMYIAQSQIKELVTDKKRFSANILETIGVTDIYTIPYLYTEKAENVINEYLRIANFLNADDSTILEKKDKINKEIKRYTDLIQNITSEQNRLKLEGYKTKVQQLHSLKDWEQKVTQQIEKNDKFVEETNSTLNSWNEKFKNIDIPLIDISSTQTYLKTVFLQKMSDASRTLTQDIENTKNEFSDYKGDLTTLLSNVSLFQTKLSELQKEKEQIEKEENNYKTISTVSFKTLGKSIKDDITAYTDLIQNKWKKFKGETDDITLDKRNLLNTILQKGLEVDADVLFDKNKMYDLLLDHLDGRSFNEYKLDDLLNINSLEDFYNFVGQEGLDGAFSSDLREDLRQEILVLFYQKYTEFIHIEVKVTLDNKPITKLSYGQQGTVYLRLQLAANMYSETIIYDQPEDDLDNDFITNELIPIFKTLKKYRQIIIVSHNANLVVNADSEQVIIAHNEDGVLSYISGSLENPKINQEVCRILEGGEKAFENRERKYSFKETN